MRKIFLLILLAAVPVRAGVGVWTPFGPGVPRVIQVAAAPGSLYALVPGDGIFRSRDDGESWQWWSLGIGRAWSVQVDTFAVDATQPLDLYAATSNQKIERSFDGGRTWVRVEPIPGEPPGILTVAGAGGTFYAGTMLGLYVLRDSGWTRLLEDTVWAIAFDPADSRILYAGTLSGLLKSADGGLSWSILLPGGRIGTVAVAPSDPKTIYAAGDGPAWTSTDGGTTWMERPLFAPYQFAVDPATPGRVLAAHSQGVSWSDDGGGTWHQTASFQSFSVAADPGRPGTFYAGTIGGGVLATHDGGRTWHSPVGRGLGWTLTTFIARDPSEPGTFYLCRLGADEPSCSQSLDGGSTWRSWDLLQVPARRLDAMAFDRRDPDVLYIAGKGVFRVEGETAVTLPLLPMQAREVLRGVAANRGIVVTGGRAGVYRSLNRGQAWKKVLAGNLWRLLQDPDDPAILYAAILETEASSQVPLTLYRSLDTGATWTRIQKHVEGLALDPSRPRTLHTTQNGRTLRSLNRGQTWRPVGESPGRILVDLVVHPESPLVLLAATWGEGVRISRDGGRTWASYNAGLARPGIEDILKLYADPVEPGRFFALPASGGTFEVEVP